jgi:8-oxo-dGTP pyrophosphatase MutT (NUDIX family)
MADKPRIGPPVELLQTPFVKIRRYPVAFGNFDKNYDVVVFGPRAGIVAVRQDTVLMTRQYRFLPNSEGWEIPGGTVSENETPETAARRECLEETGVECGKLEPLGQYLPGLDNVDNLTSLFLCTDIRELGAFRPDEAEVVAIAWRPIVEVIREVRQGLIQDVFTQVAILNYACKVYDNQLKDSDFAAFYARIAG